MQFKSPATNYVLAFRARTSMIYTAASIVTEVRMYNLKWYR